MQRLASVFVLATAIYSGGGVTKTSGLEQFWTDDYKVFDQVYGKTSDKDIYGTKLPMSISFAEPVQSQGSQKMERYVFNQQDESDESDPYGFGDKYNLLRKPAKKKTATPTFNFVSYSDFKPISQNNDPETYNYLKHLEEAERETKIESVKGTGGFKPYINYMGPNPEETDAYKSIQEILDAHEANKGKDDEEDGNSKYLTYREKNNKKNNKKQNKPPRKLNKVSKPRCLPGRCRNRSSGSYRVRSRPYYRRIKHRIY